MPGRTFGFQQPGDVFVGAAALCAEVADVHCTCLLVDAGGARNQQDDEPIEIDAHAAEKELRLAVIVGLVEIRRDW